MAAGHRGKRKPRRLAQQAQRAQQPIREMVGRAVVGMAQTSVFRSRGAIVSVDETIPDYAFYDALRRGKQPGYKLGALFAKRIEHIFAVWVLGRGVTVALTEAGEPDNENDPRNVTDAKLGDFLNAEHSLLMQVKEDALGLGDQYIFVNADGTLSVPSPDTVEVSRDPLDYRVVLSVKITTKLPAVTIEDVYTLAGRVTTYKRGADILKTDTYDNLIGRLPYVHIAHGMSGNETNGHSIHEDLLKLYDQYDDVIHKQLDGAKLLGNPILAFTGLEDLTAVIDANKPQEPETYLDMGGNEINRPMLNVDANSVMLIGKGGDGKFIAPPTGFTADTQQALKTLFLLLLDRTGIPEFIWGNELSSARASADVQLTQWAHDIEGMQKADERWLLDLCGIWLAYRTLTDPQIVAEELAAEWPPVLDENQELKLKAIEMARANNLLTDKTTLELLQLVDDAETEVANAQVEAKARADDEQQRVIAQAAATAKANPNPPSRVGEMAVDGYNETELRGIVGGALRQVAGG